MFNYREILMVGFRNAVGKMADYKVILNANGYYEKGVLTEEDLSELQQMINAKNSLEECTEDDTTINVGYEVRDNEILKG